MKQISFDIHHNSDYLQSQILHHVMCYLKQLFQGNLQNFHKPYKLQKILDLINFDKKHLKSLVSLNYCILSLFIVNFLYTLCVNSDISCVESCLICIIMHLVDHLPTNIYLLYRSYFLLINSLIDYFLAF